MMKNKNRENDKHILLLEKAMARQLPAAAAVAVVDNHEARFIELPEFNQARFFNPARRMDFLGGRVAARQAVKALGLESRPVLVSETGKPVWQDEVTGSISHSGGISVAAVMKDAHCQALGVDLLKIRQVDKGLLQRITSEEERLSLLNSPFAKTGFIDLLTFSAKESAYKCLSMLDCPANNIGEITIKPGLPGEFTIEHPSLDAGVRNVFYGRFAIEESFILSAVFRLN